MKIYLSLFLFFVVAGSATAQSDSLTMRDDLSLKYQIRKTLLPGYEKLLNFISYPDNSPNEIQDIINTKVNGSREQKLFSDAKVIIENDLLPGDEVNPPVRRDMEVADYLSNFNSSYSKSDDKTIVMSLVRISPLKYTS